MAAVEIAPTIDVRPLRPAYPTVTNAFAVLRLLPVGDRDKEIRR